MWMLPSYKEETPSSQQRVYQIAKHISCQTNIIPYNMSNDEKFKILKDVKSDDYVLVQKWRNSFNRAEFISQIKGIKIFDLDDISEDKEVLDLVQVCDILFMANHYLVDWAKRKFNKPVHLIPTGVTIPDPLPPYSIKNRPNIVIAKYGVDKYIRHIARICDWQKLFEQYEIAVRIMGTTDKESKGTAQATIGHFCKTYPLVPFSKYWKEYGRMISTALIGIMPLGKSAQGKSAFSVLSMMSAGLPVIASPYGECDHIIENGVNGFLVNKQEDWAIALDALFADKNLRQKMSVAAIKTIASKYTVEKVANQIEKSLGLA